MTRLLRPFHAIVGAVFAATVVALPSMLPSAPFAGWSTSRHVAAEADLAGTISVRPSTDPAAITPSGSERMLSKAGRGRFITAIGDLAAGTAQRVVIIASLLSLGVAWAMRGRIASVPADPRAPPLLLRHH